MDCFAALAMTVQNPLTDYAPMAIFGSASAFAFNSFSAGRYSTGITLRNFGSHIFQSARISAPRLEPGILAWRVIRIGSHSRYEVSQFWDNHTIPRSSRTHPP